MSVLVTGCGVVSPAGSGTSALVAALAGQDGHGASDAGVARMYPDPLPQPIGRALVDFDVRRTLGRKGTTFFDRRTGLALVACDEAIKDSGLTITDENRHRIGITLGTTWGSFKAMSDYTKDSLLERRPYLVNPALFPNTVLNCAAGQAAIWFGLRGVNATIAGGQLALLGSLEYSVRILRRGYADVLLAGAVEEFTPHTAWATALMHPGGENAAAEGAAVFVIEPNAAPRPGTQVDGELLAVRTAFSARPDGAEMMRALTRCIEKVLTSAGVSPSEVALVASCEGGDPAADGFESEALAASGTGSASRLRVKAIGECHSAVGAFQVAALVGLWREDPSRHGQIALVTGWTREGAVGAAVLRSWSRGGSRRR